MKTFKTAILAIFCASSLSIAGEGYHPTGLGPWGYIFGYGGVAFGPEVDATNSGVTTTYDFEDDFIGGGGIGLYSDFLCGSRFELEGLYTDQALNTINGQTVAGATGEISVAAAMINLLKEIPVSDRIIGFAGFGLGYAGIDFITTQGGVTRGSSESTIAYQGIIGADYCLSPCISLFTQYKLLGIGDTDYTGFNGLETENDGYLLHSVSAGLRYSF